ncbi:Nidogen-2 [Lamellibrachia satsuma]|nr:Nidogen-2 [Lamellibrachia satsuma]
MPSCNLVFVGDCSNTPAFPTWWSRDVVRLASPASPRSLTAPSPAPRPSPPPPAGVRYQRPLVDRPSLARDVLLQARSSPLVSFLAVFWFSCTSMRWLWTSGLLLVVWTVVARSFSRTELYPFGDDQGDSRLVIADDVSSDRVQLVRAITYFGHRYSSIYVNLNGVLTFKNGLLRYRSDKQLPIGRQIIAPFYADIDTRLSGNVYYRESQDPSLRKKAEDEIGEHFPDSAGFRPQSLFIATWDDVGYYSEQYDLTNTFQVVIASDETDSFVMFLYPSEGITWIEGQGKNTPRKPDIPAQVGFDGGRRGSYMLPTSGEAEVRNLPAGSNVDVPGMYMFRVGHVESIELPNEENAALPVAGRGSSARTCADGGADLCHTNARCRDFEAGSCCFCTPPYYGNGVACLEPGSPQRVNGKVSGVVNGVSIDSANLHVYVVTVDSAGARNGFMITGGTFNRTAVITYLAGGESITVNQQAVRDSAVMRMTTSVNGNIPNIALTAEVVVKDFAEQYRRVAPGVIKSTATHSYTVDRIPYHLKVEQTITYKECDARPLSNIDSETLSVSRIFVVFNEKEQMLRYATANKVSIGSGGDPCSDASVRCDRNAACEPQGTSYRCVCNQGYRGDGSRCQDVDECALKTDNCDVNARCFNTDGAFQCRCLPGQHARCVTDRRTGKPRCQCEEGYAGNGTFCGPARLETPCRTSSDCSREADCLYDGASEAYVCRCRQGFQGDGRRCQRVPCDVARNCDSNANCLYDDEQRSYQCACNPGYAGDGYRCAPTGCDISNNCDENAQCVFDRRESRYACVCNEGFEGDGISCTETSLPCNQVNNCDINADCLYDPNFGTYQCSCREGYAGDGYSCRIEADCRRNPDICDRNARCEQHGTDYVCICNTGFRGDGRKCGSSGENPSYIMFTQGMSIMEVPFTPSSKQPGKQTILIPGQTAIGIDVDCFSRYFYWTDVSGKTISRAKLDGTDSEVLVHHLDSPEGVAIDWIGRNMFWTDSGSDTIEVSSLDGTNRKMLFDKDLVNPRAIVVDPMRGLIFWTDWNRNSPEIASAGMDGSNRRVVVSEGLGLPNGLTIDYRSTQICWADAGTMHIECVNYDGSRRRLVYKLASYPFDIALADNVFYWTDWNMDSLPNINNRVDSSPNEPLILPPGGNGKLYGIGVVPNQCPRGSNACSVNNGGCRYLCLPGLRGGRTCACRLHPNACTCTGEREHTQPGD